MAFRLRRSSNSHLGFIDQNGGHGGHLGFPIRTILAIFDLQVTLTLPIKFRGNWPVGSEEAQIEFQDGYHGSNLGYPIKTILAFSDLQVVLKLPTMFRVNWLFSSGEEAKNRFFYF